MSQYPRLGTVILSLEGESLSEEAVILAIEKKLRGVYNVAGPPPVPLSTVCEATGKRAVPIPEPLYPTVLGRFGFPYLPSSAIAHVKYPIVIDNSEFVEATGFEPRYTAKQTMEGFRWN